MNKTFKCVYCNDTQSQEFNDEHVIPRGLGKFLLDGHELVINDRVCNKCNNTFSWCEGELAYSGIEAMHRKKIGIKGRNPTRTKESPFYQNKFSKKPIRMRGIREGSTAPNLWELDPKTGNAVELNQVNFHHPKTNEPVLIPIEKGMTRASLLEAMMQQGWIEKHPFEIFCSDEDRSWIIGLFEKDADKIEWQDRRGLPAVGKVNVEAEMLITEKHHRAVAKIAFTYLMYFKPCGITGREETFSELRAFIRYGKKNPNHFVRYTGKDVLYEAGDGVALVNYGHVVTCDVSKNGIRSLVHLFTGRELGHGAYEVNLGKYPFKVITSDRFGHWFRITSTPNDREDSGEVIPVLAPTRIVPPSPNYLQRNVIKRVRFR